jgi:hypothetical protein
VSKFGVSFKSIGSETTRKCLDWRYEGMQCCFHVFAHHSHAHAQSHSLSRSSLGFAPRNVQIIGSRMGESTAFRTTIKPLAAEGSNANQLVSSDHADVSSPLALNKSALLSMFHQLHILSNSRTRTQTPSVHDHHQYVSSR